MRILVIDKDETRADYLRQQEINVETTDDIAEAFSLMKNNDYDLVITENNVDLDGLDLIAKTRRASIETPMMVLTESEKNLKDMATAFGHGADDFQAKSIDNKELLCRVNALIRRANWQTSKTCTIGGFIINFDQKTFKLGQRDVPLTDKEYQVAELLFLRNGTIVTREMFLDHVYGGINVPERRVIDLFLCQLRKKMKDAQKNTEYEGNAPIVETVWRRGYVAREPIGNEAKVAFGSSTTVIRQANHAVRTSTPRSQRRRLYPIS